MNPKRSTISTASAKIGVIFLVIGVLALALSVIKEIQVFAFIGLGLTFWGALFLVIAPKRYVESSALEAAVLANYQTVDRIIKTFNQPSAHYTPPYPKKVPLPEHLKGLKDMIVFIADNNERATPDIQELSEGKFIMSNPPGVAISPPGIGLLTTIEDKTNTDFTKMNLEDLCETLPRLILENFGLADEIEITIQDPSTVKLKLINSVYKHLYSSNSNLQSIFILGCPILSATACAIAKTTGKPVIIQRQETSANGSILHATLKIEQV